MSAEEKLSHSRLMELLDYNAETGIFTWRMSRKNNQIKAGDVAGHLNQKLGYMFTNIDGIPLYMHRLAWFWVHGSWPAWTIDHINRNRADNRIENLRDVPRQVNNQNTGIKKSNTSGVRGVYRHARNRTWVARITVNGECHSLGSFAKIDDAQSAYEAARLKHHEGYVQ